MPWVWWLVVAGVALLIVRAIARHLLHPRLDLVIHGGGLTTDQTRKVFQALIRKARLPSSPELRELGIAYARQGARNYALLWWSFPVGALGAALISMVVAFGDNPWFLLLPVALFYLAIYFLVFNLRALRNLRRLAKEHAPNA